MVMACEELAPFDPNTPNIVAGHVINGINSAVKAAGLHAIPRSYIGVGPIPTEDCCPDLVVWITNIRLWDQAAPDTLQENRLLNHFGIAFDVNVRIGECFWEVVSNDGKTYKPLPAKEITPMASVINRYGVAAYLGAISGLQGLQTCGLSITPTPADPFQSGKCAGFLFRLSVGLI